MTTTTLGSIGDVERLNSAKGKHFFSDDTMRFFSSKIETDLIRGRFFITSEKNRDERRRFTIRAAFDDGSIETCGDFQQFASWSAADKALAEACRHGAQVVNDPYDDVKEPEREDYFNWRVRLGELTIGVRTTKAEAEAMANQLRPADATLELTRQIPRESVEEEASK
jgi:hypothetical protein